MGTGVNPSSMGSSEASGGAVEVSGGRPWGSAVPVSETGGAGCSGVKAGPGVPLLGAGVCEMRWGAAAGPSGGRPLRMAAFSVGAGVGEGVEATLANVGGRRAGAR